MLLIARIIEFVRRFLKKKYLLIAIILMVIGGLLGGLYNYFVTNRFQSMTLTLNYPGAEKGLNPDGSRFNIAELKSDEIIEHAKEKLQNSDMTSEFLKTRIFINSKLSESAFNKVVSSIQSDKTTTYMPTTFYIYYSQKNKFAKNEVGDFLSALAETYEEYFNRKYAEKNNILDYYDGMINFDDYDYPELYQIFYNKADSMLTCIQTHSKENRTFMDGNGLLFSTASEMINNFMNVSLEKFNAYIIQNKVSKSNTAYISKINYLISNATIDYNKMQGSSDITKSALTKYDPRIAAVAFVPSVDESNSYYMSRTKTGLDDLARDAYEDGSEAAGILNTIYGYENIRNKFMSAPQAGTTVLAQTDRLVAQLSKELNDISLRVKNLDDAYLEYKTKNYFNFDVREDNSISKSFIVKCGILGLIVAFAIIVIEEFLVGRILNSANKIRQSIKVIHELSK